ncbi:hypothetical protein TNCV_3794941 [Trichonephila clavipes]|nr:hypothetical protein TNCV_3794941 [Trichonephila clavipes]
MQVSPVPASDEVCPPDFWELLAMRYFGGIPSCEKCWIQVSPVPASDEVCPPLTTRASATDHVILNHGQVDVDDTLCWWWSEKNRRVAIIVKSRAAAPLTIGEAYLKIIMSSFLGGFVKGILETGGMMDKCVQMWTRNYGALGQTAPGCVFGVGQVCPDVDKELWRLGPDSSERGRGEERRAGRKGQESLGRENGLEGGETEERGETKESERESRERESEARLNGDKGLSPRNWSEKDDERRWR